MGLVDASREGSHPKVGALPPESVIFGSSESMKLVHARVQKIAAADVPVLIQGGGGSGKEVLARWIHLHSAGCAGEFVKVNCAAIPGTLLESELFGYEKGAFTGAYAPKPGRVELAHNGTLFLDEIADLDFGLQSKLLHFLQDGCFSRIGDSSERTVNTRLICATQKDLAKEIEAGRFRADLFYRINVVLLRLPRLRERREDIPILAEYFRTCHMKTFAKQCEPFGADMLRYWQGLDWPGNMRELANAIARYVLIGPEAMVTQGRQDATGPTNGEGLAKEAEGRPLKRIASEAIREMERTVILEALRENRWNRRKTAQALKISYRALIYKIHNASLSPRGSGSLSEIGSKTVVSDRSKPAIPAD